MVLLFTDFVLIIRIGEKIGSKTEPFESHLNLV
jgi:hypothetical protein